MNFRRYLKLEYEKKTFFIKKKPKCFLKMISKNYIKRIITLFIKMIQTIVSLTINPAKRKLYNPN